VLVFLLVPFYTRVLTTDQLGTGDLIVKTANLIIPLASIGMSNAIIRFGLDRANDKRDVFTGALTAIGSGYLICCSIPRLRAFICLMETPILFISMC